MGNIWNSSTTSMIEDQPYHLIMISRLKMLHNAINGHLALLGNSSILPIQHATIIYFMLSLIQQESIYTIIGITYLLKQ